MDVKRRGRCACDIADRMVFQSILNQLSPSFTNSRTFNYLAG